MQQQQQQQQPSEAAHSNRKRLGSPNSWAQPSSVSSPNSRPRLCVPHAPLVRSATLPTHACNCRNEASFTIGLNGSTWLSPADASNVRAALEAQLAVAQESGDDALLFSIMNKLNALVGAAARHWADDDDAVTTTATGDCGDDSEGGPGSDSSSATRRQREAAMARRDQAGPCAITSHASSPPSGERTERCLCVCLAGC